MIMCTAVSEEAAASDILVGAQPRIRCWTRARSSTSELVDTATARRQQRVEDAARLGLQFPFRSERRGRGAPSVATKWRDAVKAAIMHGPLPPDVTLDAPHWWLPGMPLLPPADYVAPVAKLVGEQDEISNLETIGWENHSWKYLSVIDDEINLQRAEVYVFSESVVSWNGRTKS